MNELSKHIQSLMKEKGLSTYDVARNSKHSVSAATITKILNSEIQSSSIGTLKGIAKGLGITEDEIFRVARGLPPRPESRFEFYAEAFDGQELSDSDWIEIEARILFDVEQKKKAIKNENSIN